MTEDADWGKVMHTWGTPEDVKQVDTLFDKMKGFCTEHDIPAFIGEYNVSEKKESASRQRWMTAVTNAALSRGMVPVLWDTGSDVSRREPYGASPELSHVLQSRVMPPAAPGAN
jgi:endoglucanase